MSDNNVCSLQTKIFYETAWVLAAGVCVCLAFALVYGTTHRYDETHFRFKDPYVDPLYFSASTMMGVGYGDFIPRTNAAKLLVILQYICNVALLVLLVGCIVRIHTPPDGKRYSGLAPPPPY